MKNITMILLIILLVIAGFVVSRKFAGQLTRQKAPQQQNVQPAPQKIEQQPQPETPAPQNPAPSQPQPSREQPSTLRVRAPRENATIGSPMRISGEAKGWYFEGSFPVKVTDEMGRELGTGKAQALGDWMVDDFVPFEGAVSFNPGSASQGFVVFEKDNPSGLSENAQSFSLPVTFSSRNQ